MTEQTSPEVSQPDDEVEITDEMAWAEFREHITRDIERYDPAPDPYEPIRRATPDDVGLIYAIGAGQIFPEEAKLHRIVRIPDDRGRLRTTLSPELVPDVYDWIATRLENLNYLVFLAEDTTSCGGLLFARLDRDCDGEAGVCIELATARVPQTLTRLLIIAQHAAARRGMRTWSGPQPEFPPKEDVPCGKTPRQARDEARECWRRFESAFTAQHGAKEFVPIESLFHEPYSTLVGNVYRVTLGRIVLDARDVVVKTDARGTSTIHATMTVWHVHATATVWRSKARRDEEESAPLPTLSAPPTLVYRGPIALPNPEELAWGMLQAHPGCAAFVAALQAMDQSGDDIPELDDPHMPEALLRELLWRVDDTKRFTAESGSAGPKPRSDRFLTEDYAVRDGRICHRRYLRETRGFAWESLINGSIRIVRKLRLDDGAATTTELELVAHRDDGTVLEPTPLRVPGADFHSLGWLSNAWSGELRTRPGLSAKDHVRAAIEVLSEAEMKQTRIFVHTGWRAIEGRLRFLTASGALGHPNVTVRLNPPLDRYCLPANPVEIPEAIRQSLRLLTVAPRVVTVPLLAAVYRAPLAHFLPTAFTVWVLGKTGAKKSTLAALFMNHFGDFVDKEHLVAHWGSTGNALQQALFAAKDTMLVIDDFSRDRADPRALDALGASILRAQGNLSARGRLRADLVEQPQRPPRGLLLVTGEDFPGAESLVARALTLSLEPGMVDLNRLTHAQETRRREQLRHALAGYILWQTDRAANGLRDVLQKRFYELRAEFRVESLPDDDGSVPHDRTPEILAHLALGFEEFAAFATSCGALSAAEAGDVREQAIQDLRALAPGQARRAATQRPTVKFLIFVTTMLAQRRAQLMLRGKDPSEARVPPALYGWEDGGHWLLLPDAVYTDWAASCNTAHESLPSRERLYEELVVEGVVEPSHEKGRGRRTTTVVTIAGKSYRVLVLKRDKGGAILGQERLDAGSDDPAAPSGPSRW
jgi:hypothetical protein